MMPRSRSAGFTVWDLLAVLVIAIVIVVLLLPRLSSKTVDRSRVMKDATQIRGIHQSMVQWAFMNGDKFPTPSEIDKEGWTTRHIVDVTANPEEAFKLDSTRNIYSMLMFNGSTTPPQYISPAEVGSPVECINYMVSEPVGAFNPAKALWDPAFRAHPREQEIIDGARMKDGDSHFSYAHAVPFGARKDAMWRDTSSADHAVLANRGPAYDLDGSAEKGTWDLAADSGGGPTQSFDTRQGKSSNTLLIHGSRTKWSGIVVYNDNRVIFETRPDPEHLKFTFSGLDAKYRVKPDNLFVDEDDALRSPRQEAATTTVLDGQINGRNAYLRSYKDAIEGAAGPDGRPATVRIRPFFD